MTRSAAKLLTGEIIGDGWQVGNQVKPSANATGGNFSVCYRVSKDGKDAFLKVLDFDKVFGMFGGTFLDVMNETIEAFNFENRLLEICKSAKMSKVTLLLDSGIALYHQYPIPQVPFFVLESAEEDLRGRFEKQSDLAFKFRSLHNICVGLNQLHTRRIAHQDLKPSNVLIYNDGSSKVADLGRAICQTVIAPHSSLTFSGDRTYAPPEVLYGYSHPDQNIRVYCTDMYLLGSLIVFYVTGFTMNGLLYQNLPIQFNSLNWAGPYDEVKPYLTRAFTQSMLEVKCVLDKTPFQDEILQIVRELCEPDINLRGYKKNGTRQFSVYKYVNRLNIIASKFENGITR